MGSGLGHLLTRASAAAVGCTVLAVTPASAELPDPKWRGAERVAILCHVTSVGPVVETGDVSKALCARVKALAEKDSPIPVEIVEQDDLKLQSGNTVALLVQASVGDAGERRRALIVTARTDRTGGLEPLPTYFGAAPRAAPFTSAADSAAWDDAIAATLGEVLPWLRRAEPDLPTAIR